MIHDYIFYNKEKFLNQKPINLKFLIIFIIVTIIMGFIIIIFVNIFDIINTNIIVLKENNDFKYYIYSELNTTKDILSGNKIKIDNKIFNYHVHRVGEYEVDEINKISFQKIEISINLPMKYQKNNLVIPIKIFTNKQKMYKKILKILF